MGGAFFLSVCERHAAAAGDILVVAVEEKINDYTCAAISPNI